MVIVADTCLACYTMCLVDSNLNKILVSGTGILSQENDVTPEGLQKTFATNVFGHYLMVGESVPSMFSTLMQAYKVCFFSFSKHTQGSIQNIMWV